VSVTDGTGTPLDGATVEVEMQSHEFGFGTVVDAKQLVDTGSDDNYRRAISKLFNKAVLENRHKWRFWETESDRQYANEATDWLLNQGLEMRGHACIWQKFNEGAIPKDVVKAVTSENGSYVSQRARDHIGAIVSHYRDASEFTEWDVINEPAMFHALIDVIDESTSNPTSPEMVEWYERARRADSDAQLFINEYNILPGADHGQRAAYERIIEYLLNRGASLDGIGLQAHHSSVDDRRSPMELLATFNRFASFDLPLQVTEYDNWGPKWTDQKEANYFYRFLKTTFSHPAVEGFLMWGFWNGAHWKGNAPLFRQDWSQKPTYFRYVDLVFDQWWTNERGMTGSDGQYRTSAFLGNYRITVSKDGITETVFRPVSDPTHPTTIEITLAPDF
jgi:GH35 family endo-1,4-beta-xylanase